MTDPVRPLDLLADVEAGHLVTDDPPSTPTDIRPMDSTPFVGPDHATDTSDETSGRSPAEVLAEVEATGPPPWPVDPNVDTRANHLDDMAGTDDFERYIGGGRPYLPNRISLPESIRDVVTAFEDAEDALHRARAVEVQRRTELEEARRRDREERIEALRNGEEETPDRLVHQSAAARALLEAEEDVQARLVLAQEAGRQLRRAMRTVAVPVLHDAAYRYRQQNAIADRAALELDAAHTEMLALLDEAAQFARAYLPNETCIEDSVDGREIGRPLKGVFIAAAHDHRGDGQHVLHRFERAVNWLVSFPAAFTLLPPLVHDESPEPPADEASPEPPAAA